MLDALVAGLRRGERRALAQLLSLAARGEQLDAIQSRIGTPQQTSRVVAFTGAAGVGKSTLIGRLIEFLRKQGQTVAVLACDTQSPLTGGALLGDRLRMPSVPDDGVFIRSLSAASGQGAVARHLPIMLAVLEAFGFANILIETVGAGQGDTTVRDLADVVVLLLQPEGGDDIQGEKAGLLEVVDIVAIHKADLPGADRAETELRQGLEPGATRSIPIVRVSGKTGAGLEILWSLIAACPLRRHDLASNHRSLLRLLQEAVAARFSAALHARDPRFLGLVQQWQQGGIDRGQALEALWHLLQRTDRA
jgi:LAO/AO transport system ATPase